jgi:DNA-binding CsgD family transcriptional regulator
MTPRKKSRKRPKGEDAAAAERAGRALDLRIAGASYRQIAAQLNVSEKTAFYDVQKALGTLDAVNGAKAERLRDLEARRLDVLQVALTAGVRAGDPRAVLAAVRILDRRARLFGLDAPTKIAGPEGEAVPIRIVHQEVKV